ncbi:MAG: hypothetical protein GY822_19610 [Deltaproteobacteria bacterium]|nr:hypothetical protein [Deltaproteobacteria bacterium]
MIFSLLEGVWAPPRIVKAEARRTIVGRLRPAGALAVKGLVPKPPTS